MVGGGCELVMVVGGGGVVLWSLWPSRHVADSDVAPASRVSKGRGRVRWLTCIHVDSDDDLRRHCQDDVARPLTCQVILLPSNRRAFTLTCQVVVIRPLSWRRGVATWSALGCAADVGGGRTVAGRGYRW